MDPRLRLCGVVFGFALLTASGPSGAFLVGFHQPTVPMVEYYNSLLDHYFLTAHADEMAAVEAGSAGPGWSRTGWSFAAYPDRGEFQHVLDDARTIDSALSPAPADYLVDNFHFNNAVYGDGGIGINLADYTLDLVRR